MDEGGHGCRALHRVRQPDVQRELRALAHRPGEDQQRHHEQRDGVGVALGEQRFDRFADVERGFAGRPGVDEDGHDPEREPDVADPVDDERLLGRERRRPFAVPEPDQQVAREPDQLPRDEDDEPVVGEDQEQHREHEQVQVGEEAPVPGVVAHVADRVDVDQQADRRHHDEQARGQRVDDEADVDDEVAGRDPGEQLDRVAVRVLGARQQRCATGQDLVDEPHRDDPHHEDAQHRDPVRLLAQPPPDQRRDGKPGDGQDDEERDQRFRSH